MADEERIPKIPMSARPTTRDTATDGAEAIEATGVRIPEAGDTLMSKVNRRFDSVLVHIGWMDILWEERKIWEDTWIPWMELVDGQIPGGVYGLLIDQRFPFLLFL